MMSSLATSSPVSASTLAYLMRWPVLRLIWLNETFSVSDVAGYRATGQVTSERRRKPFQLARGAMGYSEKTQQTIGKDTIGSPPLKHGWAGNRATALTAERPRSAAGLRSFGRCCRAVRPEGAEHHFRSCVALTGGVEAFAGITGTYSKRSPWQRNDMAKSSKPRPRRARPNPARRCSRS